MHKSSETVSVVGVRAAPAELLCIAPDNSDRLYSEPTPGHLSPPTPTVAVMQTVDSALGEHLHCKRGLGDPFVHWHPQTLQKRYHHQKVFPKFDLFTI